MQNIPLQPVANQSVTVTLNGQSCQIDVRQKRTGLYLDCYLSGTLIAAGCICQDRNPILRVPYSGFVGDLVFIDTLGGDDPDYTGLGTRFQLRYITAADTVGQGG